MSSESRVITVSDNIASSIPKKLNNIAAAAERARKNLDLMKKILKSFNDDPLRNYIKSISNLTDSVKSAASGSATFSKSLNDKNTILKQTLTTISSYINQLKNIHAYIMDVNKATIDTTNNQYRFVGQINASYSNAENFVRVLKKLVGCLGFKVFETTTASLTEYKAQLDGAADSAEKNYAVMQRLTELAKGTPSFEQTSESSLSNSNAIKELGYSTNQQLVYTEALNNALIASSIKSNLVTGDMYALQKAMILSKLSGIELTTVMENSGYIIEILAKQLDAIKDQLLETGKQGQIMANVIMQALQNNNMSQQNTQETPNKILEAFENLKSGIQGYISERDNVNGANNTIAESISWLSENSKNAASDLIMLGASYVAATLYNTLFADSIENAITGPILWLSKNLENAASALTVLGVGYMAATVYNALFVKSVEMGNSTVTKATAMIMRLNMALLANPIGLIIVAISAVIAALVLFSDEIKLTEDGAISLKDVAITVWDDIKKGISSAIEVIKKVWNILTNTIDEYLGGLGLTFSDVFNGILGVVKSACNIIIKLIMMAGANFSFVFNNFGAAWEIVWTKMKNFAKKIMEDVLNYWQLLFRGLAELISFVNPKLAKSINDTLDSLTINFDKAEISESAKNQLKEGWQKLKDQYKNIIETDQIGNFYSDIIFRAGERKKGNGTNEPSGPGSNGTGDNSTSDYEKLLNSLKPMRAALEEYNKSYEELNAIFNKGKIDANEFNEYIELLKNKYKESIDPLGYYNKELDRQWKLMKLSSEQRTIENELYQVNQKLMSKGLVLSQAQNDELKKKIAMNEEYVRILAIKDSLENNSQFRKNQDFNNFVKALDDLKSNENFGHEDVINALNSDSKSPFSGMFEGNWDLINAQISQYQQMYNQINVLTEQFNLDQSTAASLRAQVWAKQNDIILSQADTFFGQMAQMQNSNNSVMARIGKAAAITQAVVNTYQAANAAYAAMAGIPYIGPALGAAAAAAAIAAGMANVSAIRSQSTGFMAGGYTGDIGRNKIAGVVHGQEFVMNAAATRRIGVDNLEALQRGDMSSLQYPQVVNNYSQSSTQENTPQTVSPIINIALVSDFESAEQWLSTQEGIKQIMRINRDNGEELATIVNAR
ncbi:tape measure protein [Frischella perrara]|uniref:tape measure protein n=1 Tax=Frischella perrara TaxID=1267021 RepID=UPI0023F495E1|nr:tape measure protein [Frischella perrara]